MCIRDRLYYALRWPLVDDMSNYLDPDGVHMRYPYPYVDGDMYNPLFLMNKNKYYDESDRIIGNIAGIIQPNSHIFLRAQYGWDIGTQTFETSEHPLWAKNNYEDVYKRQTWNFAWVRKANVMIDRITNLMPEILTDEQYNHWTGVGRFFRALEYARLVNVFGDVPYYDTEVQNTDKDGLYKDRTPRNEVMDAVYNDFEYALHNVRLNDGGQSVSYTHLVRIIR